MRSFRVSSFFSLRRIRLMEVPGDRATSTVLLQLSLGDSIAVVHESDREQGPATSVCGVPDDGALGEAFAHAAVTVVDVDHPRAAALASESQLVSDAHARRALVAQQEGKGFDDRRGGGLLEGTRLAHDVSHPPEC